MNHGQNYYTALIKKYEAQIEEAKANLSLYFDSDKLTAIGEHSDLMIEQDKWIQVLADVQGKLDALRNFNKI